MPQSPAKQFYGIFVCYRRDDSSGHAGHLFENLEKHFGTDKVFMDIDTIEPGEDFVRVIEDAVSSCEILIAIIGRYWLSSADKSSRRIDNPNDFVRLEIRTALDLSIPVIPVLVHGARMPTPYELPDDLAKLSHRGAVELSDRRWPHDVEELIAVLERILARREQERLKMQEAIEERLRQEVQMRREEEEARLRESEEARRLQKLTSCLQQVETLRHRKAHSDFQTGIHGDLMSDTQYQDEIALASFSRDTQTSKNDRLASTRSRLPSRRLLWITRLAAIIVLLSATLIVLRQAAKWKAANSRMKDQAGGVAARVNGEAILLSEVDYLINQRSEGKWAQMSLSETRQARAIVLDKLIDREILYQRAEQENLVPSEQEISEAISKQMKDWALSESDVQTQLKNLNITETTLRVEAKKDLAIQKLYDKTTGKITISDSEVKDYYVANKQHLADGRGVGLAMIAIDPQDNSAAGIVDDARGEQEAKIKIESIYQQLRMGADFATLAKTESEDANSLERGGDIGFASEKDLKENLFPISLIAEFFGTMEVGSFSAPVQFSSGRWYIFKLQSRNRRSERLTLERPGVRTQIIEELMKERKEALTTTLLTTLKNDAKIVNYLALDNASN